MKSIRSITDTFREVLAVYLIVILACSALFCLFEGKPFIDSVWWAFVTAMTVGYGDIYPVTIAGRVVAVFLMHVGTFFVLPLAIAQVIEKFIENKNEFSHQEQEQIKIGISNIESYLKNKNEPRI